MPHTKEHRFSTYEKFFIWLPFLPINWETHSLPQNTIRNFLQWQSCEVPAADTNCDDALKSIANQQIVLVVTAGSEK